MKIKTLVVGLGKIGMGYDFNKKIVFDSFRLILCIFYLSKYTYLFEVSSKYEENS